MKQLQISTKKAVSEDLIPRLPVTKHNIDALSVVSSENNIGKNQENGTVSLSEGYSGSASEEGEPFEAEEVGHFQTFFNPETGEAYVLTPGTSIHSYDENSQDGNFAELEPTKETGNTKGDRELPLTNTGGSSKENILVQDRFDEAADIITEEFAVLNKETDQPKPVHSSDEVPKKVSFAPKEIGQLTANISREIDLDDSSEAGGEEIGYETDASSVDEFIGLSVSGKLGMKDLVNRNSNIKTILNMI